MRINTNVAALTAHRNLSKTGAGLNKSIERLSSGLRINRAGDDAAGLVISEKLRAESSSLRQAARNAQDGISFVQTVEGALDEVSSMLTRMRDLTVQHENGVQDSESQAAIQAEYSALYDEIVRIGAQTQFAGSDVFVDGTGTAGDGDKAFQVGKDANQTITAAEVEISADSIGGADLSAQDTGITSAGLALLDTAIAGVAGTRGDLGAVQNRLESTVRNLSVTSENLAAAESRIRDVDVAEEMMSFTRSQILQQAGTAMLAQANGVSQG
ncbi:MAG: flagellin FliC, partial [Actinobacteria bacterium]|nr:flagellin FliC [Actinomycetota bacterium]